VNETGLKSALSGLPVGQIHYFDEIGSTNDFAHALLEKGAPDGTLVAADTQTQGRGRFGRKWVTIPGAALAFSLALRPDEKDLERLAFYAPLAGLAVCQALTLDYRLPAEVKWPNDVLLARRKTCGILVEAVWQGSRLQGVVVGIGVNVAPSAVPPDSQVLFPATCVEQALGHPLDRVELMAAILRHFYELRPQIGSAPFLRLWEEHLAFRGEEVRVDLLGPGDFVTGRVEGVDQNGNLRLRTQDEKEINVAVGDVKLRPLQEK
jgi:BirA family transcriptional regulator, biotin operon repressor / biotin---[acetyl-CoA-carboxylase] ligase